MVMENNQMVSKLEVFGGIVRSHLQICIFFSSFYRAGVVMLMLMLMMMLMDAISEQTFNECNLLLSISPCLVFARKRCTRPVRLS